MELSRDKIKEIINDDWLLMDDCEGNKNCDVVKELARIALASLEAEAVGTFRKGPCGYSPSFHEDAMPLYASPPAPVSVPDLKPVGFLFVSDDGAVAYSPAGCPMKGFNLIGPIYGDVNACRAAKLHG